jgi:hypothetical protein
MEESAMKSTVKAAVVIAVILKLAASPASASIFDDHKKDFDYDKSIPLNAVIKVIQDAEYYTKYSVYFDSANGERIPAFYYVPKDVRKYRDSLDPETL